MMENVNKITIGTKIASFLDYESFLKVNKGTLLCVLSVCFISSCSTESTQIQAGLATVSTSSISSVTDYSAQSGGNVTDDGGASVTKRGVCLSTTQNPTTSDYCTSDGSGTGSFTSNLNDLSSNTQYFVRAYATNSEGTTYGDQLTFTTDEFHTVIVEVFNPATGRTWMDRNLGASRAATSSTDEQAYGYLYQWGRATDGHEKRNSATVNTLSNSDQPGHGCPRGCGKFILASGDWRNPQNDNLWQGVNGINNPCPNGYRIPIAAEWQAELDSWSIKDEAGAFESPLKLPLPGRRLNDNGSSFNVGIWGEYWAVFHNPGNLSSQALNFGGGEPAVVGPSGPRAKGNSVRCIKDLT